MASTILFPTDYSDESNAALRYALSLARQSTASLLVVHVQPPTLASSPALSDDRNDDQQGELLTLLTSVPEGQSPVPHDFKVVQGEPVEEIVRMAREKQVELIVMATKGRTGLRRILMGSVAAGVLKQAPCPVLNIKHPLEHASGVGLSVPDEMPACSAAVPLELDPNRAFRDVRRTAALSLFKRAIDARATDIHLDPFAEGVQVRFRIDGRLDRYCRLDRDVAHSLITQLKVMAGIDISDPFHPSEGHISLPGPLASYEVRLTRVPVAGGESIALRLLDRRQLHRPLDSLGLSPEALQQLTAMLQLGEGLVLITGPAGAGKTTSAYAMIHAVDDGQRNIVSIEDPIEFHVDGFRQMAVDTRHGVTMTSGLRTILRMDPDIVLVGEIRDCETAEMAMRAASSGKYVFATLHTRDVALTITALRDLHIDNRSLAGNLTGIISQRLVRRLCPHCRTQVPPDHSQTTLFSEHRIAAPPQLPTPGRCPKCRERGYRERIGVFEVAVSNRGIREAIERGAPEDELRQVLRTAGTQSLFDDGLSKVHDQITSLEEVSGMTWVSHPAWSTP